MFTQLVKMASENEENIFPKCSDVEFWTDRQRVVKLIELYELHECLWNASSATYRNIIRKKAAKEEIGKVFSMTSTHSNILR